MLALFNVLAAEGPNGKFLPGDIWEFWWGSLAFLIIAGLFVLKGLPLISKALSDGQAAAVAEATAAETAAADARARIAATTAQLGDANAESQRIVAEANETAQQLRVDAANRTQQLVNDMWTKAQSDVEAMKTQAQADIKADVASQAVGAAEQVVRKSLDPARHASLIDDYISKLGV